LPDPVVGEVAAPTSLVRQRGDDGLLVEGNPRLPRLSDLDELRFRPIRDRTAGLGEEREPS
jgi:hypothetical protein